MKQGDGVISLDKVHLIVVKEI